MPSGFEFQQTITDAGAKLRFLADQGIYYSIGRAAMLMRQLGLEALRREAPKRTGAYARSIIAKQRASGLTRSIRLEFYGAHPLSQWIIGGTRPHEIRPVRARVLHFVVDGEEVFARLVHHPGTKPNPFHQRALDSIKDKLPPGFAGAINEVLRGL